MIPLQNDNVENKKPILKQKLHCKQKMSTTTTIKESIASLLIKAKNLYLSDHFEESASLFSEILLQSPDHYDALRWRGLCRTNLDNYSLAFSDLNEANKLNPHDVEILRSLGVAQIRIGSFEKAIKNLEEWN